MLEKEMTVFNENLESLTSRYPEGGFVVIQDNAILGVWVSREDALKEGYRAYGNTPFLVKDIRNSESVANFTRPVAFA